MPPAEHHNVGEVRGRLDNVHCREDFTKARQVVVEEPGVGAGIMIAFVQWACDRNVDDAREQ